MMLVRPVAVTDTTLTSTTIAEPDTGEAEWTAGTYSTGVERISSATHRVYRVVADPSTTTDPTTTAGAIDWEDIGPTNAWAMFDNVNDTQSTASTNITVVLTPGVIINSLAGFNVTGASSINVTMNDATDGEVYNTDIEMTDSSEIDNWYDFFFSPVINISRFILLDIPPYPEGVLTVTVDSGSSVGIGTLLYGNQTDLGVTLYGTSWQLLDFSIKERNEFGNFVITQRRNADLLDYDFIISKTRFNYLKSVLKQVTTIPAVWVGDETDINDGTAVFGYYRDIQVNISSPDQIDGTIQVEGLT